MHNKKVMVCVTQQKSCEKLIERGVTIANKPVDELFVIHVVKNDWKYFGSLEEPDALDYLFDVSKKNGASLSVLRASDIEKTLSRFAQDNEIDLIVMGKSQEKTSQQNMIKRLQKHTSKEIIFDIVSTD